MLLLNLRKRKPALTLGLEKTSSLGKASCMRCNIDECHQDGVVMDPCEHKKCGRKYTKESPLWLYGFSNPYADSYGGWEPTCPEVYCKQHRPPKPTTPGRIRCKYRPVLDDCHLNVNKKTSFRMSFTSHLSSSKYQTCLKKQCDLYCYHCKKDLGRWKVWINTSPRTVKKWTGQPIAENEFKLHLWPGEGVFHYMVDDKEFYCCIHCADKLP